MNIVVMTSDHYLSALRPFAYLFQKYWGKHQPVTVVGFKEPEFDLPANFSFLSMGDMEKYPLHRWSDCLIDFIGLHVSDSHMILMLEDYWLVRPVNVEAVRMLWDYAHQFQYVLKIDLCADRLYAAGMSDYGHCGYLDLVKSDPASQYHFSLMSGVWNTNLMLRFLRPMETPWKVELEGTPRVRAAGNDVLVLGTRNWPLRHTLAHRSGDPSRLLLDELDPADVQYMREREWI